jgi:hypothetical protein
MDVQMTLNEQQVKIVSNYDQMNPIGRQILSGFSSALAMQYPQQLGQILQFATKKKVKTA